MTVSVGTIGLSTPQEIAARAIHLADEANDAPQTKFAHAGSKRARYMHAAHSSLLDCANWRSVCLSDSESAP